jgi:mercuric ion transport protein
MSKERIIGASGLLAAGIGSVCCVGPVILASMGLGAGALSFARSLGFLHIPMMILAVGLIGTAFFIHFKRRASNSEAKCCEAPPGNNRKAILFLWLVSILTILLFTFPYLF